MEANSVMFSHHHAHRYEKKKKQKQKGRLSTFVRGKSKSKKEFNSIDNNNNVTMKRLSFATLI